MAESLETYAKYPFLSGARKHVESLGLSMAEIMEHPVYSASVDAGRSRVIDALNNKRPDGVPEGIEREISVLSYPIARLIAHLTKSGVVLGKYAGWEAERAHLFLKAEDANTIADLKKDLSFTAAEGAVGFQEYLTLSSELARFDPHWKLANRTVDGGRIILTPAEELRLLSEAVRLRVLEPVKLERVPKKLREIAEKIRPQESMEAIKISSAKVDSEDLPPCIRRVLSLVEAGEASHNIMFILGTYLVGRGMNTDEAVEVFRRFPSFSEEKARYQLSFLSGEKGGTKYSCPSCAKIKSYNLCEWDCGVKHPLNYKKKGV